MLHRTEISGDTEISTLTTPPCLVPQGGPSQQYFEREAANLTLVLAHPLNTLEFMTSVLRKQSH